MDSEETLELTEREAFRKQISTISFEDLLKLKSKIGSKRYDEAVSGTSTEKSEKSFKRANKNRPREASSKKYTREKPENVGVFKARDPRFDPLCGTYDDATFKSNYKFVEGIKKRERTQLQEEYNEEHNRERKEKIKLLMNRMDNQLRESEKHSKRIQDKKDERRHIRQTLSNGETPAYKTKAVKRVEHLIDKYDELKRTGKLQKHFQRRYKKLEKKDKKRVK